MKSIKINRKNLITLLDNLRKEDLEELKQNFKNRYREKFINVTLNSSGTIFLADDNDFPLAIGGVDKKQTDNLAVGQVWLISSNKFTKKNLKLIKFIVSKIEEYKKDCDILFNFIYKSNFDSLKWLAKCGFKTLDTRKQDYKLFYFTKGGIDFDIRYITDK